MSLTIQVAILIAILLLIIIICRCVTWTCDTAHSCSRVRLESIVTDSQYQFDLN